eukprot:TRINITY_DN1097_c0_g1_i1.p1 TRINITY_DN1097_c0_g1~~TRINITY_DN1097_c0_g1_i1.p1  ORF type:complete len:395 (+),score=92.07 TRINITY_DN1097_c0_g1_i1:76-1260(+)
MGDGNRSYEELTAEYQRMKKRYHGLDQDEARLRQETGQVPDRLARQKRRLFREIKAAKKRLESMRDGRASQAAASGEPGGLDASLAEALGRIGSAAEAVALVEALSERYSLGAHISSPPPPPPPPDPGAADAAAPEVHADPQMEPESSPPPQGSPVSHSPRSPIVCPAPEVAEGAVVEVMGLQKDASLNGQVGCVLQLRNLGDGSPGAVVAFSQASGIDRPRLLRLGNLGTPVVPAVGRFVEAGGLSKALELNGQRGQVLSMEPMSDGSPGAVVGFPAPLGQRKLPLSALTVVVEPDAPGAAEGDAQEESNAVEQGSESLPDEPDSPRGAAARVEAAEEAARRVASQPAFATLAQKSVELEKMLQGKADKPPVGQWLSSVDPKSKEDPFVGMSC